MVVTNLLISSPILAQWEPSTSRNGAERLFHINAVKDLGLKTWGVSYENSNSTGFSVSKRSWMLSDVMSFTMLERDQLILRLLQETYHLISNAIFTEFLSRIYVVSSLLFYPSLTGSKYWRVSAPPCKLIREFLTWDVTRRKEIGEVIEFSASSNLGSPPRTCT